LPLTYNRDMQDDKEIIAAAQTATDIIEIIPELINNINFNMENMKNAAVNGFTDAADFAEYLVIEQKMEFRIAHQKVGQLVRNGIEQGYKNLSEFSLEEIKKIIPETENDVFDFIDINNAVKRRLHR